MSLDRVVEIIGSVEAIARLGRTVIEGVRSGVARAKDVTGREISVDELEAQWTRVLEAGAQAGDRAQERIERAAAPDGTGHP